ncbi:uncharacterized protein K444DRAFT_392833 [Hyaloscypha bicolor E]|uniref:Uncharacterized protein n=1 Tax=Hyaloscypha bicolor E TaxID=1095630 RepID=A0A2J6TBV3_9HELO|nr:uncharacterized protein K444DRAFT_392833 [Hyaloscypha bicolor E]PMD60442.1 hypothetical protein K444DRAFT_392833 [Hyaloscypha bicolor E]
MDRASQVLAQGVPPGVPRSYRALADHGNVPHSTLHHRKENVTASTVVKTSPASHSPLSLQTAVLPRPLLLLPRRNT